MKRNSKNITSKSSLPEGCPEFVVDRDTIRSFFRPEISTSKFHELVKDGAIVPFDGLRGFYRLNESLLRLGLRPVSVLPTKKSRSNADMFRWAMSMIETRLFPVPDWAWDDRALDPYQEEAARFLVLTHGPLLATLESDEEKLNYLAGALDAYDELELLEK